MMNWTPLPAGIARVVVEKGAGYALEVGDLRFDSTWDADALGALCFAYGLDNQLFGLRTVEASGFMWLSWHFCALVSRQAEDPGLEAMTSRALEAALALAPTAAMFREVRDRFEERHRLVVEHALKHKSRYGE